MSKRTASLFAKEQLVGCINSTLISPNGLLSVDAKYLKVSAGPIDLLFERFGQQGEKRHG
jgi:hypothetical protein